MHLMQEQAGEGFSMSEGKLYIVGTPIGNLGDISERARQVLQKVDAICAEDTRHSGKLLSAMSISTAMIAVHEHNEHEIVPQLLERIRRGEQLALITDAGMPIISDPGARLTRAVLAEGMLLESVPGPSAVTTALAASGFRGERFYFGGFLPETKGRRAEYLQSIAAETATIVMFLSPHRFRQEMTALLDHLGDRPCTLCRELTKIHEEQLQTTLAQLVTLKQSPKGELVLVIAGASDAAGQQGEQIDAANVAADVQATADRYDIGWKEAVDFIAFKTGLPKRAVYQAYQLHRKRS